MRNGDDNRKKKWIMLFLILFMALIIVSLAYVYYTKNSDLDKQNKDEITISGPGVPDELKPIIEDSRVNENLNLIQPGDEIPLLIEATVNKPVKKARIKILNHEYNKGLSVFAKSSDKSGFALKKDGEIIDISNGYVEEVEFNIRTGQKIIFDKLTIGLLEDTDNKYQDRKTQLTYIIEVSDKEDKWTDLETSNITIEF